MFVVVAVKAKQLPVAAVGRIVVMVVIFVVHRELAQPFARKFTAATSADRREQFQCPFPIALFLLFSVASGLGNDLVQSLATGWSLFGVH